MGSIKTSNAPPQGTTAGGAFQHAEGRWPPINADFATTSNSSIYQSCTQSSPARSNSARVRGFIHWLFARLHRMFFFFFFFFRVDRKIGLHPRRIGQPDSGIFTSTRVAGISRMTRSVARAGAVNARGCDSRRPPHHRCSTKWFPGCDPRSRRLRRATRDGRHFMGATSRPGSAAELIGCAPGGS